jgi:hypothetical protein
MTSDFLVLEDEDVDLSVYVSAHSSLSPALVTGSATFDGRVLFDHRALTLSTDFEARVPTDAYVMTIPLGDFSTAGDLDLSALVSSEFGDTTDSVTLKFFPPPTVTHTVSTDAELEIALEMASDTSAEHFRIQFATGTYTFPASWNMTRASKLVTFEPETGATVTIVDSVFPIRWARWKDLIFQTTTDATAFPLDSVDARHVFERCRFHSTGSAGVGISVSGGADGRLEGCVFENVAHAVVGASVVRGAFWANLTGIVFRNVSRLLEGCVGYGLDVAPAGTPDENVWASYDGGAWTPVIRHNLAIDMMAPVLILDSTASFDGAVLAGNVFNTHSERGWVLPQMVNSYVAHNSVWTEPTAGSSIVVSGNRYVDNAVHNNYFGRLDTDLNLLSNGSTWSHNATESSEIPGTDSIAGVVPGFANRYLIPTKSSTLLRRGLPQAGMETAFGTLKYQTQIGAMPYHPDSGMSSVLAGVISYPDFGLSVEDSPDGDFVAPDAGFRSGGAALIFSDGTQSGLLGVI